MCQVPWTSQTFPLHKSTLSCKLSFNLGIHKYVKCGWSLNLYIYIFLVKLNIFYRVFGTSDVLLIKIFACFGQRQVDKYHKLGHLTTFLYKFLRRTLGMKLSFICWYPLSIFFLSANIVTFFVGPRCSPVLD